jgi:hypothetical protein
MGNGPYASCRAIFIHPYSSKKLYIFEFMDEIKNDAKCSSVEYVFIQETSMRLYTIANTYDVDRYSSPSKYSSQSILLTLASQTIECNF